MPVLVACGTQSEGDPPPADTPQGAGGGGGLGGSAGVGGKGGVSGSGGGAGGSMPGAGQGGAAGGTPAPPFGFDGTYGEGGLVTLRPAGVYADDYGVASLYLQPSGKMVVAVSAQFDLDDPTSSGRSPLSLLRLNEAGRVDETYGEGGVRDIEIGNESLSDAQINIGVVRTAGVEPAGGLLVSTFRRGKVYYYNGPQTYFGVTRLDANGEVTSQLVQQISSFRDPPNPERFFVYGAVSSPSDCFLFNDGSRVGGDDGGGLYYVPCIAGLEDVAYAAPLPLPAGAFPLSGRVPGIEGEGSPGIADEVVSPFVAGTGIFVPLGDVTGRVGVAKLVRSGASGLAFDPSYGGGSGYVLSPLAGVEASALRLPRAAAADAAGNVYLAGELQLASGEAPPVAPFVVKILADGGGFDPAFGVDGVAATFESGSFACVLVDDRGRVLVAGSRSGDRGGSPALARLTPGGELDPTFADGGVLALPFEPKRCAFDGAGGVVIAGAARDALDVPFVGVVRVFNADGPPEPGDGVPAPPSSCPALDDAEPNDAQAQAAPMMGPYGSSDIRPPDQDVRAKSFLTGPSDVEWFHYTVREGNQLNNGSVLRASLTADASAQVCVYLHSENESIPTTERFYCSEGSTTDSATVPSYLGCCGLNEGSAEYTDGTYPLGDLDVFVRVSSAPGPAPEGCHLYRLRSGFF